MELDINKFCLFVGYARSGSSAVGSIIDAHPNAIISHEVNILTPILRKGWEKDKVFSAIIKRSSKLNKKGRWSGGVKGEVYKHVIEGQIKNKNSIINVIGDKKSDKTTRTLRSKANTDINKRRDKIKRKIDMVQEVTTLPCMFIHVIRNPYDMISAQIQSSKSFNFTHFRQSVKTMSIMKEMYPSQWIDIYHDDLIKEPRKEVCRIIDFLGLKQDEKHIEASVKHLNFTPTQRRLEIDWNKSLKKKIKGKIIKDFEFFNRYSFKY